MKSLHRALALAALTSLAACGGGSSAPSALSPAVTPAVSATAGPAARTANAKANFILKFPAHTAKAKFKTAKSGKRIPAYINPNGGSLVIVANGVTLGDPNNNFKTYFSLGVQDLTTGVSTVSVPLPSGYYGSGALVITEWDNTDATGNRLAVGYNSPYTDSNGNYNDGSFSLNAGGTANPVVTMAMNATSIAVTTDPINGNDATVLSTDSNSPTLYYPCTAGPSTLFYFFAADPSGLFVLPGLPTGAGYTGGDSNSAIGVPQVTLQYQNPVNPPATLLQSNLARTIFTVNTPGGSSYVSAGFQVNNPASAASNYDSNYNSTNYGYVGIGLGANGGC